MEKKRALYTNLAVIGVVALLAAVALAIAALLPERDITPTTDNPEELGITLSVEQSPAPTAVEATAAPTETPVASTDAPVTTEQVTATPTAAPMETSIASTDAPAVTEQATATPAAAPTEAPAASTEAPTATPEEAATSTDMEEPAGKEDAASLADAYLVVMVGDVVYNPIPLTGPNRYVLRQGNGEKVNIVEVTEDSIWMAESTCDNQDCIYQGKVSLENRDARVLQNMVLCLPHNVTLLLMTQDEIRQALPGWLEGQG